MSPRSMKRRWLTGGTRLMVVCYTFISNKAVQPQLPQSLCKGSPSPRQLKLSRHMITKESTMIGIEGELIQNSKMAATVLIPRPTRWILMRILVKTPGYEVDEMRVDTGMVGERTITAHCTATASTLGLADVVTGDGWIAQRRGFARKQLLF